MTNHKFTNMTSQNIMDDIISGEAMPSIEILKRSIMESWLLVCRLEKDMMVNRALNNGLVNPKYVYEFQSSLVFLWNLIKYMARSKGLYSIDVSTQGSIPKGSDYELMVKAEYYNYKFTPDILINLKNYLEFILHRIKISDLLIKLELDLDRDIKEEY